MSPVEIIDRKYAPGVQLRRQRIGRDRSSLLYLVPPELLDRIEPPVG